MTVLPYDFELSVKSPQRSRSRLWKQYASRQRYMAIVRLEKRLDEEGAILDELFALMDQPLDLPDLDENGNSPAWGNSVENWLNNL